MRRIVKLLVLLPMLLLLTSCIGCGAAELTFHSLNGSCAAVNESTATISVEGDRVLLSGGAITSTPCHDLEAELALSSDDGCTLMVEITAHEQLGACIQCIGEVPFTGEIGPLDPGEYDVSIVYEGSTIAQQRVEIE